MEVLSNARVDHLGLVAGFAKEMKLAERIDKLLGVYPDEKVTVGESVVAMILNGVLCRSILIRKSYALLTKS